MPQPTAEPKVVQDGRFTTASVERNTETASGAGGRPSWNPNGEDDTPADVTQDALWASFESAHRESAVPQAPDRNLDGIPAHLLTGHPKPEAKGLVGAESKPEKQAAQVAPGAQAGGDEKQSKPLTPKQLEEHSRAFAALQRDGWSAQEIEALSPDRLLEVGLKRAKSQGDVDAKLNGRRDDVRGSKEKDATPASGGPGQTAPHTSDESYTKAADEIGAAFTDQFGDEVGGAVKAAFGSTFTRLSQENKALVELVGGLGQYVGDLLVDGLRRDLVREYPEAGDEGTWANIRSSFDTLRASGAYEGGDGMRKALDHARRIVLPGLEPASVRERRTREDKDFAHKSAARPTTTGQRQPVTSGSTGEDAELFAAFNKAHDVSASLTAAMTGAMG